MPCHLQAYVGGTIALLKNGHLAKTPNHGPIEPWHYHRAMPSQGDKITVDAEKLQLTVDLSDAELKSRKDAWKQPPLPVIWMARKDPCIWHCCYRQTGFQYRESLPFEVKTGYLAKYARLQSCRRFWMFLKFLTAMFIFTYFCSFIIMWCLNLCQLLNNLFGV